MILKGFAAILKGVSLLIHETTFEDDLIADAIQKRHTTFHEALQIAADADVAYLVCTHFSQRSADSLEHNVSQSLRYQKHISREGVHHETFPATRTVMAEDGLSFAWSELPHIAMELLQNGSPKSDKQS